MKVTVIPIVIGALGKILKSLVRGQKVGNRRTNKKHTTTAMLRWARILRRVLET